MKFMVQEIKNKP